MENLILRLLKAGGLAASFLAGCILLNWGVEIGIIGVISILFLTEMELMPNIVRGASVAVFLLGLASLEIEVPTPNQLLKLVQQYGLTAKRRPTDVAYQANDTLVVALEKLKQACDRELLTKDECSTERKNLVEQHVTITSSESSSTVH